jgi:hypothetical protein
MGFEAFNVAADDVCVPTPTRELLRKYYPQCTDLRADLVGREGLVSCSKLKSMLDWRPQHHWKAMAAESETQGFAKEPPSVEAH